MNKYSKLKEDIFTFLQRLSQSFMLPIALMPIAGFLLAIGASFTDSVVLTNIGLVNFIHEGTSAYVVLSLMKAVGGAIFDNLPIIFAMSVAIGFSNSQKAIAAISSIISFIAMHQTISSLLVFNGIVSSAGKIAIGVPGGMINSVLGFQSLQIGVFGGIFLGWLVAQLNNRFKELSKCLWGEHFIIMTKKII